MQRLCGRHGSHTAFNHHPCANDALIERIAFLMSPIKTTLTIGCVAFLSVYGYGLCHPNSSLAPHVTHAPPAVHVETTNGAMFTKLVPLKDMRLFDVESAGLPPDAPVLGVIVEGQPRAYAVKYLEFPDHVYHDQIGETYFSVTYCEVTACARVIKRLPDQSVLAAGWSGSEMMLRIDGEYWAHSAEDLPLADLDFEKTDWLTWSRKHPETLVYNGEGGNRKAMFGEGPIPIPEEMRAGAEAGKARREGRVLPNALE